MSSSFTGWRACLCVLTFSVCACGIILPRNDQENDGGSPDTEDPHRAVRWEESAAHLVPGRFEHSAIVDLDSGGSPQVFAIGGYISNGLYPQSISGAGQGLLVLNGDLLNWRTASSLGGQACFAAACWSGGVTSHVCLIGGPIALEVSLYEMSSIYIIIFYRRIPDAADI